MKHFVGLDVSVKETSICVVDGDGDVVLQTSVPSEPRAIVDVLAVPSLAGSSRARAASSATAAGAIRAQRGMTPMTSAHAIASSLLRPAATARPPMSNTIQTHARSLQSLIPSSHDGNPGITPPNSAGQRFRSLRESTKSF